MPEEIDVSFPSRAAALFADAVPQENRCPMEIQVFRLSLIEGRHAEILISRYAEPHEIGGINANASRRSCSGSKWGVTMSDDFDGTEDAKAAIRAAVQYLLKESQRPRGYLAGDR